MNLLTRLALLAYPRSFRREYGTEWSRTVSDLQVHSGLSTARIIGHVLADLVATAPRMRWESTMGTIKTLLTIVAVIVGAAGLVIGSPALAVPVMALLAVVAIQASRHDQPISAEVTAWSARWYVWLAAGVGFFLVGFGALFAADDGELSSVAWATWMLSWLSGAIVVVIGLGLGATQLASHRRA